MRVLINTIPLLTPLTGVGNYTYSLIKEFKKLKPEFEYFYYYGYITSKFYVYNPSNAFNWSGYLKKIPLFSSIIRKLKSRCFFLQKKHFDIYFEPNFIPLERIKAKKTIVTVHDLSFFKYPQWHPEERINYFQKNFFSRLSYANIIVTPSNFIKEELKEVMKNLRLNKEIITIYNGYDPSLFYPSAKEISKRHILFVGSIEPRKNLKSLLLAYKLLPEYLRKDFQLLIIGFKGWKNRELFDLIKNMGENVIYKGYVPKQELADAYRKAICLVYPSFYEGFGLPALEAIACGCPVIASSSSSLSEVLGDSGYYIDPHDIEAIAKAITDVIEKEELRLELINKGLLRAKRFTWEKSAKKYLQLFEC